MEPPDRKAHVETLPDELLMELGRITVSRARLDGLLDSVLGTLTQMDDYLDRHHALGGSGATFAQRVEIFGSYCSELVLEYPQLTGYRHVLKQLKTVPVQQDLAVCNDDGKKGLTLRDRVGNDREEMTLEYLCRISQKIASAHEILYTFGVAAGQAARPEEVHVEIHVSTR